MQSKATTVEQYLAELPEDRRAPLRAVREVILKNLDRSYEEGMQYGMIGYYVPHRIFPAGYHCDPRQPLPFASIASQKSHLAIYLMSLYLAPEEAAWFRGAWAEEVAKGRAKKLDMGKSCIRFRKLEEIPLGLVGEAIRRSTAKKYIKLYEVVLAGRGTPKPAKKAPAKGAKKAPAREAKPPAKNAAKKPGATASRVGKRG